MKPYQLFLALVVAAVLSAPSPAAARYACAVKPTSDGFVALRGGPSTGHPVIARMRAHELVGLLHPDKEEIVRSGDWLFVRWYPGARRTADVIPDMDESKARAGWVRDRLINCFE